MRPLFSYLMKPFSYQEACSEAAKRQGLNPIMDALIAEGVLFTLEQTGGFVMVVYVPVSGRTVGITSESCDPAGNPLYWLIFYDDIGNPEANSVELCTNGKAAACARLLKCLVECNQAGVCPHCGK